MAKFNIVRRIATLEERIDGWTTEVNVSSSPARGCG